MATRVGRESIINADRLLQTFLTLLQIDSPSGGEGEVIRYLKQQLQGLGVNAEIDDIGNLLGFVDGQGEPLLLCAHVDHVPPCKGIKPQVRDGVIRSDGNTVLGGDDTSGVAIMLEILHLLRGKEDPPALELVFTVGEEIGLVGAKGMDFSRLRARSAIVLDMGGPMGCITRRGPSQNKLSSVVHGKKAHAACAPEQGINAILIAAEGIAAMALGRIDEETTANVGVIQGGEATNIVPDRVELKGEARSLDETKLAHQTQAMVSALDHAARRHGASVETKVELCYSSFHVPDDAPIIRQLSATMRHLGVEPILISTVGGSDSNILNQKGIQAVNISTGMEQVHTTEESIALRDMVACASLLVHLLDI